MPRCTSCGALCGGGQTHAPLVFATNRCTGSFCLLALLRVLTVRALLLAKVR